MDLFLGQVATLNFQECPLPVEGDTPLRLNIANGKVQLPAYHCLSIARLQFGDDVQEVAFTDFVVRCAEVGDRFAPMCHFQLARQVGHVMDTFMKARILTQCPPLAILEEHMQVDADMAINFECQSLQDDRAILNYRNAGAEACRKAKVAMQLLCSFAVDKSRIYGLGLSNGVAALPCKKAWWMAPQAGH